MRRRSSVLFLLGLLILIRSAAPAAASWSGTVHGSASAKSTTITAPGTLSASCNLLLSGSVRLDWQASSSPWVTQYEVQYGTNASSPSQSVLVTGLTFSSPTLSLGTWYFTVRSAKGTWRSATSNQVSKVLVLGLVCL
jgi:hypothetical protein